MGADLPSWRVDSHGVLATTHPLLISSLTRIRRLTLSTVQAPPFRSAPPNHHRHVRRPVLAALYLPLVCRVSPPCHARDEEGSPTALSDTVGQSEIYSTCISTRDEFAHFVFSTKFQSDSKTAQTDHGDQPMSHALPQRDVRGREHSHRATQVIIHQNRGITRLNLFVRLGVLTGFLLDSV